VSECLREVVMGFHVSNDPTYVISQEGHQDDH